MGESRKVVGIGAGAHAELLAELIGQTGQFRLVGFTDSDPKKIGSLLAGVPVLGDDTELPRLLDAGVQAAFIGVGTVSAEGSRLRKRLFQQAMKLGFKLIPLIHPQAVVSASAQVDAGAVVMAGAILSAKVRLGRNVTLYSGAVVEHHSVLEDHAFLTPGVRIAGGVHLEEGVFVGIGACINQKIRIGAWATVGAGSVVLRDLPSGCTAVGNPARVILVSESEGSKESVLSS